MQAGFPVLWVALITNLKRCSCSQSPGTILAHMGGIILEENLPRGLDYRCMPIGFLHYAHRETTKMDVHPVTRYGLNACYFTFKSPDAFAWLPCAQTGDKVTASRAS